MLLIPTNVVYMKSRPNDTRKGRKDESVYKYSTNGYKQNTLHKYEQSIIIRQLAYFFWVDELLEKQ